MKLEGETTPARIVGYRAVAAACLLALSIAGAAACGGNERGASNHAAPDGDAGAVLDASVPDASMMGDGPVVDEGARDVSTEEHCICDVYVAPSPPLQLSAGWARTYASGDPLNATPAVLAAYGDGVVFAGASSDPAVVGVARFPDASVTSEAFVGRLQHDGGSMWAAPLHGAGMPAGVAETAGGDVVVVAPWLPGQTMVSIGFVGTDIYLGKFTADGAPVYEKDIALPPSDAAVSSLSVDGVAVDSSGAAYVVGSISGADGAENIAFTKVDSSGALSWNRVFAGDGPGFEMTCNAAVVLPGGDVVIGGDVNGHVDFGGGKRSTLVAGTYETMAYLARFTAAGQWVSDVEFGTGPASTTFALAATSDGGLLVGGFLAGTAKFGPLTVSADFQTPTAYVAALQSPDSGLWGALIYDGGSPLLTESPLTSAVAVDTLGYAHATGQFDGRRLVANYAAATGELLAAFTVDVGNATTGVAGASLAVDSQESVWVSGALGEHAKFGAITLDGAAPEIQGVPISSFIVRLDPATP